MEKDSVFERYSRQIFIEEIGVSGQRKIMNAKVLIAGAGGIGSPAIQYLAAAGVGTIAVADFDQVELHNLNRQVIHTEKMLHQSKAESAGNFVQGLNSQISFVALPIKIDLSNVDTLISDYELVIDCSDNFTTRYLLNDACVRAGKPLVYGSILGFEGQCAVFNYQQSKQLRDLFPEPPHPGDVPDCDHKGVLGPLPGIIGSMMALQALKIIAGLPVDTNQLTIIDTLHWNFMKVQF